MPHQLILEAVHDKVIFLARTHGCITHRSLALFVKAPINFGIGVSQLDGDVPFQFVLETNRMDPGQGLDHRRLAMGHVTNGT